MKLYDFDGMFDKKLSDYMQSNKDKYTQAEWEDLISRMYARFGDTVVKSIGKTPNGYYAAQSDGELIKSLVGHIRQGVPVNRFLLNAVESRHNDALLLPLLDGSDEEASYAIGLLGASPSALPAYLKLLSSSCSEDIRNSCVDLLKERADAVKEQALASYRQGVQREYMLEILSRCLVRDDEVFNVLLNAFRTADENMHVYAGYLAAYGDERALPYLLEAIEDEGVCYADFQELNFAIEALGGSYDKVRDFSSDPAYGLIKSHGAADVDIFKNFK